MIDLDTLSNSVRDRFSKRYFIEAVRSYNAQAYRSATISLWVAVAYDLFVKIRELAGNGDRAAKDLVDRLDRAVAAGDSRTQQQIEHGVLDAARSEFEFLSEIEYQDLLRLVQDRHRCAHPALNDENALFEPSPELVRSHLRHAVEHLMAHPPVQGKAALDRITTELSRDSFPGDEHRAREYLTEKYLGRCKPALARNLTNVLLKALMRQDVDLGPSGNRNLRYALMTVASTNAEVYEDAAVNAINPIVDYLEDDDLLNVGHVVGADARMWEWLSRSNQLRVEEGLRQFQVARDGESVKGLLAIPRLATAFRRAVDEMDDTQQSEVISLLPDQCLELIAAEIYKNAMSYRGAEARASRVVIPMLPVLSSAGVSAILEAVLENDQIRYAGGTPGVIDQLWGATTHLLQQTSAAWKRFAEQLMSDVDPDGYYAYPEIREKIEAAGIDLTYPTDE